MKFKIEKEYEYYIAYHVEKTPKGEMNYSIGRFPTLEAAKRACQKYKDQSFPMEFEL